MLTVGEGATFAALGQGESVVALIVDKDGKPVQGVRVMAFDADKQEQIGSALSNETGFAKVPVGSQRSILLVPVPASGFTSVPREFPFVRPTPGSSLIPGLATFKWVPLDVAKCILQPEASDALIAIGIAAAVILAVSLL